MINSCAICGTQVLKGSAACGKCGLPLSPAGRTMLPTPRRRLLSSLGWLVVAVGAGFLLLFSISRLQYARHENARAELKQEMRSGSLATPDAFQARCGHAANVRDTKNGPVVVYDRGSFNLLVSFPAGKGPTFEREYARQSESGRFYNARAAVSDDFALDELHSCR